MASPTEIVRRFHDKLRTGDAAAALALLASNIAWTTTWQYKAADRGPVSAEGRLIAPMVAEWASFSSVPAVLIAHGDTVVSRGTFVGVHRASAKQVDVRFTHVWTVRDSLITQFQQHFDALPVAREHQI